MSNSREVTYIQHEWKGENNLLLSHEIKKPNYDKPLCLEAINKETDCITIQRIIKNKHSKYSVITDILYKSIM